MEAKISTFSGMVMGFITNYVTGNMLTAIATAALTGAAAYIGQQLVKYVHNKIKRQ